MRAEIKSEFVGSSGRDTILNHIRYGDPGVWVKNDENGRMIERISSGVNTLPDCSMYENGEFVGTAIVWDAVSFLYGE